MSNHEFQTPIVVEIPRIYQPATADDFGIFPEGRRVKIEQSKPELAEAYIYAAVGAVQGVYRHLVAPIVEDQPILFYAVAGIAGGLAVGRLIKHPE